MLLMYSLQSMTNKILKATDTPVHRHCSFMCLYLDVLLIITVGGHFIKCYTRIYNVVYSFHDLVFYPKETEESISGLLIDFPTHARRGNHAWS